MDRPDHPQRTRPAYYEPMAYHQNYCTDCEWSASTECYNRHEVSKRAIAHFCETGHTIGSEVTPALTEIALDNGH